MTNTKKIIIFLTPLSNEENRKHRNKLLNDYCQQHNFTISRIIEGKNAFDYSTLQSLINEIKGEPKGTFTVLIEDKILNNPDSIILTSVLGTLYSLELINTEIYTKSYEKIKFYESTQQQDDFLSIANFCLYYILECNKNNNLQPKN